MTDPVVKTGASRRDFLKSSAAVAVATHLVAVPSVHAAGSDVIKVGLVGCGGRGTGAAEQSINSSTNVKLHAMGDLFQDHLNNCRESLTGKFSDKVDVADDRCFIGFDAYKKVIDSGVDLVILATPPGFRPEMIKATIAAGKHLFCEKPVAVDGPGIRTVLAAAEEAKAKKLAIVAGTQRRHQAGYIEAMKRIHDGGIGDLITAQVYWNQGGLWSRERQPGWSDAEFQIRNWLYYTYLSGDHICEQHVHNLDVMNWAFDAHPERCVALGGRQVRTAPIYGNIFDHFAVEYEYSGGRKTSSQCRQIDGCANNVSETIVGTKGSFVLSPGNYRQSGGSGGRIRIPNERNPYEQEHIDLIDSIRSGNPMNELRTVAESTLTAIMGRMSAYTGQAVTWEQALESKLELMPKDLGFGPMKTPPVAVPGETQLI
ncbi:Gfo/Idh/MocA family oxidoreductase [Tundrisphaera lichenicola]|uniref:Gfo/Idh/MocA family oxidoreductase n=1 Tax=Tundrisphaera lichenicola TaxID=2029860 RepID=UPI003EBA06BA